MSEAAMKRARELLIEWNNRQMLHPIQYKCVEGFAAALDAWAQEARLEEAKWWWERIDECSSHDESVQKRIAKLERAASPAKAGK
jgi:hypothetical protein